MTKYGYKPLFVVSCAAFLFYSAAIDSKGAIYKGIMSAGGGFSTSVNNKMIGTIGQPVVGLSSNNSYSDQAGVWRQVLTYQSITFPSLATKKYGDVDFDPGAVASSELPVTYTSSNTGVATIVAGRLHIVGTGSTTITAHQSGSLEYHPASDQVQVLTVTPATLAVTADSKIKKYGSANPELTITYSGFINGDTPADLTTEPTVATTVTATSGVGSYPITVVGGVSKNYDFSYFVGTLTVTPAVITVSANNASKAYGSPNPELNISYNGFVNGDTVESLENTPTAATTATTESSAGTYAITVTGGISRNYTFNYIPGILTIEQAVTNVTLSSTPNPSASGASVTFGTTVMPSATGYITFFDNDAPLGMVLLVGGAANYRSLDMASGTHKISAVYSGDINFVSSTSTVVIHTVKEQTVNGVCDSSNGGTFATTPTVNLCSAGAATTVNGSGPWTWNCTGTNGGITASCTANIFSGTQVPVMDGWWLMPGVLAGVGMLRIRRSR